MVAGAQLLDLPTATTASRLVVSIDRRPPGTGVVTAPVEVSVCCGCGLIDLRAGDLANVVRLLSS
jgi:hypothetical protein